ncbi:hypothetical protein ACRJ4W_21390 [Streptomyces sp. GLT-R25]
MAFSKRAEVEAAAAAAAEEAAAEPQAEDLWAHLDVRDSAS